MIAHEHVQMITMKDVVVVFLSALIAAGLLYMSHSLLPLSLSFVLALLLLSFMGTLVVHLVQKTGMFMIFYGLAGLFTLRLDDIGVLGYKKIVCLMIAALLFEIVYLVLKFHVHFISFDLVVGSMLSAASVPLISALLITSNFTLQYPLDVFNLMMLSLVAGLAGSVVACIIWHDVKDRRLFIELDLYLKMVK